MLLALLMAASMWLCVQLVLIPYQNERGPMRESPRGNLSDLYPRWLGARELLLHHRDPYRSDITREIQAGYYGRPLDPARPHDPKDQQAFAYPIYVVLILAPTITLPFAIVHRLFFWMLALMTVAAVPLWMRFLRWRVSKSTLLIWILLTAGSFPAIQALKLQQLTLVVALLIAWSIDALSRGRFVLAGVLLAVATIKPQLVCLLILWVCIWAVGAWRERQRVVWSLALGVLVLITAGEILLPGWIGEFRGAMKDYYNYTGGGNLVLDLLVAPFLGKICSVLLAAIAVVLAWRNRLADSQSRIFQWMVCVMLATTMLLIRYSPYNLVLLLPAAMILVRDAKSLWQKNRISRLLSFITALTVFWPYIAATALLIALAVFPGAAARKAWGVPFFPTFTIPFTIYGLLLVSRSVLSEEARPMADEPARLAT